MKIIDLLNKIANEEENDLQTEFEFDGTIWNFYRLNHSKYCLDFWLLNQNITITKHKENLEENKIPEKIKDKYCSQISKVELAQKYNEIIDYLESKGDE